MTRTFSTFRNVRPIVVRPPIQVPMPIPAPRVQVGIAVRRVVAVAVTQQTTVFVRRVP